MHVLGIDAAEPRRCAFADQGGSIVSEGRGAGANLQSSGDSPLKGAARSDGDRHRRSPITPSAICLGIAGVDRDNDERTVRAIMRRIGYKSACWSSMTPSSRSSPGRKIRRASSHCRHGSIVRAQLQLRRGAGRRVGTHHRRREGGTGSAARRWPPSCELRTAAGPRPSSPKMSSRTSASKTCRDASHRHDRECPRECRGARTDRPARQRARRQ